MDSIIMSKLQKMTTLRDELYEMLDTTEFVTFEDKNVVKCMDRVFEALDDTIRSIKYYSLECREGKLHKMHNDKFELLNYKNQQLDYFGCGSSIECYCKVDGKKAQWYSGRVEYTYREGIGGYYFHCPNAGHPLLFEGMKARVRRNF